MYSQKPLLHQRQQAARPGRLRTIAVDVTSACNMTCGHCYAETFRQAEPVSLEVLGRAFDQFHDLGVFHYVFQGGEPIMAPGRLEAILGMCHPDESYLNVVSNGWRMTPETIRWLKALQVDKITFSLDSGLEAEHDARRLPGSYRKVLQAVDEVLAEGLLTSLSIVITHGSLHSEGFRRALEIVQAKGIRMDAQIAEPVGKWDGRKDDLITPEDAAFIKSLQLSLGRTAQGQTVINRDVYCGDRDHCPAGTEFMGLTADGQLLPCNFLQYSLGHVADRDIAPMREALIASPWFDGSRPHCICGEDPAFIDQFIVPYVDLPKPLDARAVFGLGGAGTPAPH
jgi:MoaA/NifB/PqqE/SkfB family radical SAM enzyme